MILKLAIAGILWIGPAPLAAARPPSPGDTLIAYPGYACALGPFSIHTPANYSPAIIQGIAQATEDVALALVARFGTVPQSPFQLAIADSRRQFTLWAGRRMPAWTQAVALERPPRIVLLGPGANAAVKNLAFFEATLLHELTHAYLYRLHLPGSGIATPGWFQEGLAEYVGNGMDRRRHGVLIRGRLLGKFRSLAELERIVHTSTEISEVAYAQALVATRLMAEWYGKDVFEVLFDDMRRGLPFPAAFFNATGDRLPDFQRRYDLELLRRYNLLLVMTDPQVLFILLPLLVIVVYLVKRWRSWSITSKWEQEESERHRLAIDIPEDDAENS